MSLDRYPTPANSSFLEGVELSIVGYPEVDYPHRLRVQRYSNGSLDFLSGSSYEILKALQLSMKFRYKALEGKTWWDWDNSTKTLKGMVGQVFTGEANFSISQASVVMLPDVLEYLSFLIPTSHGQLSVVFRQPRSSQDVIGGIFSYQIILFLIAFWICIAASLVIMRKFANHIHDEDKSPTFLYGDFGELGLWCFSTLCSNGWYLTPSQMSVKNVALLGTTFAYLISLYFSAQLTSTLATEKQPIRAFEDLQDSGLMLYGDRRLPVVREIVNNFHSKKKKLKQQGIFLNYQIRGNESMRTILESPAAFATFEDAAKSVPRKQGYSDSFFCDTVSALNIPIHPIPNAMFVKKGISPLREAFNIKIAGIVERGISFRVNTDYDRKTSVVCPRIDESYRGGLGFTDVYLTYFILLIGITICITVFLLEKFASIVKTGKRHE